MTSQATKSNPETMGRFHTKWLNMMYPRLRLAANLLKDDGVIFISIDDNEVHNLRKVCDEVFGEENFVGEVVRKTKSMTNDIKCGFNIQHEYIIIYAKYIQNLNLIGEEKNFSNYSNPDNDLNGEWCSGDPSAKSGSDSTYFSIINPFTKKADYPPKGRFWAFSKQSLEKYIEKGKIKFKREYKENERGFIFKRYKNELNNVFNPLNSLFADNNDYMNQASTKELNDLLDNNCFNYPKPVNLIKRLIQSILIEKDDIILDFFSGSATTAHAIMQLNAEDGRNRQFILVQLPELCDENSEAYKAGYQNICEIGKERIRRASKKIVEENSQLKLGERETPLDVGFKVFKLDTSNLNEWNSIPINDDLGLLDERFDRMLNKIKLDRNQLDVVYEIILKMGFPLSTFVTEIEVSGKKCFIVGEEGILLICLEHALTLEDVEAMAEYKPAQLIFSKQSFVDINVMINAHYRIRTIGIEIKLV